MESLHVVEGDQSTFTVRNKTDINRNVARVVFHGFQASIKKFYSGLKLAGKGYSITSLENYVSRYYIIK